MLKPKAAWLMAFLLGCLSVSSIVRAQVPDRSLTLELLQRIEQLEWEVRNLRGDLELYRHQVELLQEKRSSAGQPAQPVAPTATTPPPVAPATEQPAQIDQPISVPPSTDEDEQTSAVQSTPTAPAGMEQATFDAVLFEFSEGRYPQAITGFQQFLQMYPDSPLAGEAQYWLGESYYLAQDYAAAKQSLIDLGLRYPNSERLPDALLKLGYTYEMLGDLSRAEEVLQKLLQAYPDTQAASLARQRLLLLR